MPSEPMKPTGNSASGQPGPLARVALVVFALSIIAATWALAGWRVWQDRNLALENTRLELETFATGLGLHVETMVADVLASAMGSVATNRNLQEEEIQSFLLAALQAGGSHVRALFIQKDGKLIQASRTGAPPPPGSVPPMQEPGTTTEDVWFGVVHPDAAGNSILPVARRVPGSPGEWAGGFILISELNELYRLLRPVRSTVGLVTLQGRGLVQLPTSSQSYSNVDLSRSAIFQQFLREPVQRLVWLDGANRLTGARRLFAVYRLRNLPAITSSSRDHADALSGWWDRTVALGQFLALLTALVLALAIALQLMVNRRWRQLRGLAEAEARVVEAQRAEITVRQSLTRALLEAQERERQRLSVELHDGIGQDLALLRNRMVLLKRTDLPVAAREHVSGVLDLATQAIEDLRNVAYNLRPMHLEELGLSRALRFMAERLEMSSELLVRTHIENVDDMLNGDAAMHVYRIAQEALSNVLRHANAREVWLDVIRGPDQVEMRIRDNGRGMDDGSVAARGLGLSSVSERAAMLGATIELQSNDPSGTLLVLRIPVRACDEEAGVDLAS